MKIVIYAKAPDATEFYRVRIPAKYMLAAGHEVRLGYAERNQLMPDGGVRNSDLEWADIIVFQRPVTEIILKILEHIKAKYPHKPLVADYDDDYYSVPRWNPGYPHVKMNERHWKAMVPMFDGIMTSTDQLREVMKSKVKPEVEVCAIANGFDFDMFDPLTPLPPIEILAPEPVGDKLIASYTVNTEQFNDLCANRTVCAWAGSKFHYVDLDWLPQEVELVCKQNDDIVFLFVGYIQGNIVKKAPTNRLYTSKGLAPISEFYRFLKSVKIDILLAPLDPCEFNRSKSNLKILESMAIGAYPICSAWDPYEDDLDPELHDEMDNVHGSLVPYETGAWARAIIEASEKLKDPSYKRRFAMENDGYVRATHGAELRTEQYIAFFQRAIDRKKQTIG